MIGLRDCRIDESPMLNPCNPIQVGAVAFLASLFVVPSLGQRSHTGVVPPQTPPAPQVPPPSAKELVRRAMERDVRNWEQEKNYTFLQRIEQRELNSDGSLKSQKSQTEEIVFLYEQPYAHLIKRNDQPLADSEAHKVENKLNDTMQKRKNETP